MIDPFKVPRLRGHIDLMEDIGHKVLSLLDEESPEAQHIADEAIAQLHDLLWELERLIP